MTSIPRVLSAVALSALICGASLARVVAAPLDATVADSAPPDRGSVSVGLLVPSSGPLADLGADVSDGFKYYLATHGDRLAGFRIDIHEADEGAATETAAAGAKDLIETQKSDVVVGLVNSDHAYALADTFVQAKVPLIIAVAGADGLTQQKANPLIFRVTKRTHKPRCRSATTPVR